MVGGDPGWGKLTVQKREGEAKGPQGQRPARVSRGGPSWTEFARLADQAVVALAGAGTINRAEPRACGHSRGSRRPDSEPGTERTARTAPNGAGNGPGRAQPQLAGASNRIAENSLYGMIRGGGGNRGRVWCPFAPKPERVDTSEGIDLNFAASPPYSTSQFPAAAAEGYPSGGWM